MSKRISPQFFICLMTAVVSKLSVTGSKGEEDNMACVNAPVWHTALGDSVRINCTYLRTEESTVKHFYRENPDSEGTDLISTHTSPMTRKDRFSLTDNKEQGFYTVMISMPRQEDTGRYRCAKRTVNDNFTTCLTQIHLHIVNKNITPTATHTGKAAKIKCPYPDSHENNTKYLCKGEDPLNCVELIQTTEGEINRVKGRFSIRDHQRLKYFNVNIENLSTADSGTYWCGSDRKWHNAAYTKINLSIDERRIKTKKSGLQQTTAAPSSTTTLHDDTSDSGRIGITVAFLALLVTAGIVLTVFIHKLCRTQGGSTMQSTNAGQNSEENHNDRVYEEIKERNQGASSGDTTLSVCALVNRPAEQLHYASVSFQQEAVTISTDRNPHPDTDQNVSSDCEYSSVRMTQGGTHLPPLYSTVKNPEEL
ncbi:CMRF35-like molecule 8 [Hippoglossus stenolepis]|uniref:CMRF35-like molecule 8 n=1 Tax=Hippoglossus stenolepis TaxID=195615 RepID=UPI00159CBD8E|nr:CMRF35-like molecule 8 [Hippoglossus stenolepis]